MSEISEEGRRKRKRGSESVESASPHMQPNEGPFLSRTELPQPFPPQRPQQRGNLLVPPAESSERSLQLQEGLCLGPEERVEESFQRQEGSHLLSSESIEQAPQQEKSLELIRTDLSKQNLQRQEGSQLPPAEPSDQSPRQQQSLHLPPTDSPRQSPQQQQSLHLLSTDSPEQISQRQQSPHLLPWKSSAHILQQQHSSHLLPEESSEQSKPLELPQLATDLPIQSLLLPPAELSPPPLRERSESVEELQTFGHPLTEENLRVHDPTMASTPSEAPTTPTSKQAKHSVPTDNAQAIRIILLTYGIRLEADTNNPRLNDLRKFSGDQLLVERHSAMKDDELANIRYKISLYKDADEITFFSNLWILLITERRSVEISKNTWQEIPFGKAGVVGMWDTLFHRNAFAGLQDFSSEHQAILAALPKLKTPKPDIAYGFDPGNFYEQELTVINANADWFRVSPSLVSTFFIVECKGATKNVRLAEFQAARGASALVRANRRLNRYAGFSEQNNTGAEDRTCVFSLCLDPRIAIISVHWAETTPEGEVRYHSHMLKEYTYSRNNDPKDVRRDVNNILEWGVTTRRPQVNQLIDKLKSMPPLKTLQVIDDETKAKQKDSKKRKTDDGASSSRS